MPRIEVGSLSLTKHLVGFERGNFQCELQYPKPLGSLPFWPKVFLKLVFLKLRMLLVVLVTLCVTNPEFFFGGGRGSPKKWGKWIKSEIWGKVLSSNQIPGFLNWLYLNNRWMNYPDFLGADTNSERFKVELKFFGWVWSKMGMATHIIET